jgi:hypothetical protein
VGFGGVQVWAFFAWRSIGKSFVLSVADEAARFISITLLLVNG